MKMKITFGLVLAFTFAANAQMFERFPNRLVGGAHVSLKPAFDWWSQPSHKTNEVQPMTEWHHITGTVKETGYGWIVDAMVEIKPGKHVFTPIVLRHPPVQNKRRYDELIETQKFLLSQLESLKTAESWGASDERSAVRRGTIIETMRNTTVRNYRNLQGASDAAYVASINATRNHQAQITDLVTAQSTLLAIAEELKTDFPTKTYYSIDYFAMHTHETYCGMVVYEFGTYPH